MADRDIKFKVGFITDTSGLSKVKASLAEIQKNATIRDVFKYDPTSFVKAKSDLKEIKNSAYGVQQSLTAAFNPKNQTLDLSKFQSEMKSYNQTITQVYNNFSKLGSQGKTAFMELTAQMMKSNTQVKESKKQFESLGESITNAARWTVSSMAIRSITTGIQNAISYAKQLDASLTNIQVVTGKSADEMARFAQQATNAAQKLSVTTTAYTDAARIFYQQGLSDKEVKARTETTMKVSNVTGLSGDQSAEYLTAVTNGFNVNAEGVEKAMDILANVGAHTASSFSELSEAMAKVSSTAHTMGVSEEQLAATISTVESATRQNASQVGTAFKTIYMRISDIQAGTEDAETTLGNYTGEMARLGFNVLNSAGELRDMGDVIEEIGGKWSTLSREQQISLARTMAGTRQANNLLALFNNWDKYTDALNVANDSTGALQEQQERYDDSVQASLSRMKASYQDVYDSLLNRDNMTAYYDTLTKIGKFIANIVDGIGGLGPIIGNIGGLLITVFSSTIADKMVAGFSKISSVFTEMRTSLGLNKQALEQYEAELRSMPEFRAIKDEQIQNIVKVRDEFSKFSSVMNDADRKHLDSLIEQTKELELQKHQLEENKKAAKTMGVPGKNGISYEQSKNIYETGNRKDSTPDQRKAATEHYEASIQRLNDLKTATLDAANSTEVLGEKLLGNTGDAKLLDESLSTMTGNIQQVVKAMSDEELQTSELTQVFSELGIKVEDLKSGKFNLADVLAADDGKIEENIQKIANAATRAGQAAAENIEKAKAGHTALYYGEDKVINNKEEKLKQDKDGFKGGLQNKQVVQNLTKVAGAAMSVYSAFNSIKNIGSIWNNKDISTGQKIMQTIAAVASVAMTLPTIITGVTTVLKPLVTKIKKDVIPAHIEQGAAAWASLGPYIIIAGIILAVIAVLTALVMIIQSVIKAHNADAEAAENAAKQAQKLSDAYNEASKRAKELRESIKNLAQNKNPLKDLIKGTKEYTDALNQANEETLEFIRNNDLRYGKDWTRNVETGLIEINQETLDALQQEADLVAYRAQSASILAKSQARQASTKSQATNTAREIFNFTYDSEDIMPMVKAIQEAASKEGLSVDEFTSSVTDVRDVLDDTWSDMADKTDEEISALIGITKTVTETNELLRDDEEASMAAQIMAGEGPFAEISKQLKDAATDENGIVDQSLFQKMANDYASALITYGESQGIHYINGQVDTSKWIESGAWTNDGGADEDASDSIYAMLQGTAAGKKLLTDRGLSLSDKDSIQSAAGEEIIEELLKKIGYEDEKTISKMKKVLAGNDDNSTDMTKVFTALLTGQKNIQGWTVTDGKVYDASGAPITAIEDYSNGDEIDIAALGKAATNTFMADASTSLYMDEIDAISAGNGLLEDILKEVQKANGTTPTEDSDSGTEDPSKKDSGSSTEDSSGSNNNNGTVSTPTVVDLPTDVEVVQIDGKDYYTIDGDWYDDLEKLKEDRGFNDGGFTPKDIGPEGVLLKAHANEAIIPMDQLEAFLAALKDDSAGAKENIAHAIDSYLEDHGDGRLDVANASDYDYSFAEDGGYVIIKPSNSTDERSAKEYDLDNLDEPYSFQDATIETDTIETGSVETNNVTTTNAIANTPSSVELTDVFDGKLQDSISDQLLDFYNGKIQGFDLSAFTNASKEDIEEIIRTLSNGGLSFGDNVLFNEGDFGTRVANTLAAQLAQGLVNKTFDKAKDKVISEASNALKNLEVYKETAGSDKSKDAEANAKAWQELEASITKVGETFPSVQNSFDILKNHWLEGTESYQEALESLENQLQALEKISLAKNVDAAYDKFTSKQGAAVFGNDNNQKLWDLEDIKAKVDESDLIAFETELNNFLNAEYSLSIAITADATEEFDSTIASLKSMDDMASKIGASYKVAGSDIKELNEIFPGILENATYMTDGTVQLNQEIAQSAMASAAEAEAADTDKTLTTLKNAKAALDAQIAQHEIIRDSAKALAENENLTEKQSAEYRANIDNAFSQLEANNDATLADQENDNAVKTAEVERQAAENTAKAWLNAYAAISQASATNAENARKNANYAAGKSDEKGTTVIDVNYSGEGNVWNTDDQSVINSKDSLNQALSDQDAYGTAQEVYAKLYNTEEAYLEGLYKQRNSIEGAIGELNATLSGSLNKLNNVASGLGADGGSGNKNETDLLEDLADLYHDINNELTLYKNNLEALRKEQANLDGEALKQNLQEQVELLNKQADAQERLINLSYQDAANQKASLATNFGFIFDEDGMVSNYSEVFNKYKGAVNTAITKANASGSEEDKKAQQAAQKMFEEMKKKLSEYETLVTKTIPGYLNEQMDIAAKRAQAEIDAIEVDVTLGNNLKKVSSLQDKIKNEIVDEIKSDDYMGQMVIQADAFEAETKAMAGLQSSLSQLQKGYQEAVKSGDTVAQKKYIEQIYKDSESLYNSYKNIKGAKDNAIKAYQNQIKAAKTAYDNLSKLYDFQEKQLNHQEKIAKILYGDKAYSQLSKIYDKQEQVDAEKLSMLQQEADYWQNMMDQARIDGDEESYKIFKDNWTNAINSLDSAYETSADHMKKAYENAINDILQTLTEGLTNGMKFDWLDQQMKLMSAADESYLDSVNAAYALYNLESKWKNAINDNTDSRIQSRLTTAMNQQLAALREKDKLTQTAVDRAEKEYDLMLKQIALEEAQNNKNTMKLQRDANGNYSYAFTADQNEIANARQELEAARNELYNFDKEAYKKNLESIYSLYNEWQEAVTKIYQDVSLTDEQREQELYDVKKYYGEQMNVLTAENADLRIWLESSANQALNALYGVNQLNFQNMINLGMIPYWNSGIQDMIDKMSGKGGFEESVKNSYQALEDKADEYKGKIEALGTQSEATQKKITSESDTIKTELEKDLADEKAAVDICKASVNLLKTAYEKLTTQVGLLETGLSAVEAYYTSDATGTYMSQLDLVAAKVGGLAGQVSALNDALDTASSKIENLGTVDPSGGSGGGEYNATLYARYDGYVKVGTNKTSAMWYKAADVEQQEGTSKWRVKDNAEAGLSDSTFFTPRLPKAGYTATTAQDGKVYFYDKKGENYYLPNAFEIKNNQIVVKSGSKAYKKSDLMPSSTIPSVPPQETNTVSPTSWRDVGQKVNLCTGMVTTLYGPRMTDKNRFIRDRIGFPDPDATWTLTDKKTAIWEEDGKKHDFYTIQHSNGTTEYKWLVDNQLKAITAYKTGGLADFTGPAWLDGTKSSPELVLNASDTENLLSAVSIMRGIVDNINKNAFNNVANMVSNLTPNTFVPASGTETNFEQTVNITAHFEGKTEAEQIQKALDNLTLVASQKAFKQK